jgi:hypothetical protein
MAMLACRQRLSSELMLHLCIEPVVSLVLLIVEQQSKQDHHCTAHISWRARLRSYQHDMLPAVPRATWCQLCSDNSCTLCSLTVLLTTDICHRVVMPIANITALDMRLCLTAINTSYKISTAAALALSPILTHSVLCVLLQSAST